MKAPWLKNALIGTSSPVSVAIDGPLGAYMQNILAQPIEPAQALSQAIGAWAACHLASITPCHIDEHTLVEVPHVQANSTISPDTPLARLLTQVMEKPYTSIQYEACTLLASHQLTLPYHLLPTALEAGQRSVALRTALVKALGLHGQWLARFNKQWNYAVSEITESLNENDQRLWSEGNAAQRESFFKRCRTHNPAYAREILSQQLKEMSAKERHTFISLFSINLSADDEPVLTPLTKDRSRDVKQTAALLLSHIPQSALSEQAIGWLSAQIKYEKGFIKSTWHCTAPLKADPQWTDACIEITMPKHANIGGERAWWLYQLVRLVPLSWWTQHTGMSARELIRWAQKTDWTSSLLRGWLESATAQDTQWIVALLEQPAKGEFNNYVYRQKLLELLASLSIPQRQVLWDNLPESLADNMNELNSLLNTCHLGETIPETLSHKIMQNLKHDYESGKTHFRSDLYSQAIVVLAPKTLNAWQNIQRHPEEQPSKERWFTEMTQIVEMRHKLYQLIPEHTAHSHKLN